MNRLVFILLVVFRAGVAFAEASEDAQSKADNAAMDSANWKQESMARAAVEMATGQIPQAMMHLQQAQAAQVGQQQNQAIADKLRQEDPTYGSTIGVDPTVITIGRDISYKTAPAPQADPEDVLTYSNPLPGTPADVLASVPSNLDPAVATAPTAPASAPAAPAAATAQALAPASPEVASVSAPSVEFNPVLPTTNDSADVSAAPSATATIAAWAPTISNAAPISLLDSLRVGADFSAAPKDDRDLLDAPKDASQPVSKSDRQIASRYADELSAVTGEARRLPPH